MFSPVKKSNCIDMLRNIISGFNGKNGRGNEEINSALNYEQKKLHSIINKKVNNVLEENHTIFELAHYKKKKSQ